MEKIRNALKTAWKKIRDILCNLSGVSAGTWARLILMLVALLNLILTAFGVNPIELDGSELYTVISVVFALLTGLAAYWKNNSFTAAAQAADEYLHSQGFAKEESLLEEDSL